MILHAPKNGFFFVIDRTNGKFISAKNFVDVNWATGYDKNGRPMETPEARVVDRPREIIPSAVRRAQLAFDVVQSADRARLPAGAEHAVNLMDNKNWTIGGNTPGEPHGGLGWNLAMYANVEPPKSKPFGRLIAWDPVKQKEAWRQEHVSPWNGGTLTTAGNLVFQGTADGRFVAYNAKTGDKLWETADRHRRGGGPGHLHGRRQAVRVDRGGLGWRVRRLHRATDRQGPGTVYTFALGGSAQRRSSWSTSRARWCRA